MRIQVIIRSDKVALLAVWRMYMEATLEQTPRIGKVILTIQVSTIINYSAEAARLPHRNGFPSANLSWPGSIATTPVPWSLFTDFRPKCHDDLLGQCYGDSVLPLRGR